ncbi:hypothetical protein V6N11_050459 [Hibiscus sabdariffa]|uniref:Uncharacterized protein n=2 Tax=Hibiscus sabdariffa TaxID=183260 RepID=A0ABR2T9U9_9ROSI
MRSTFAFVRFSNMGEAIRAVELGNNCKMDGFTIKVFLEKKCTEEMKDVRKQRQLSMSGGMQKKDFSKVLDGRTYKEALLMNHSTRAVMEDKSVSEPKTESYKNEVSVVISELEYQWLEKSLVGRIKAMYDVDLVQQALRSDGFRVKVCRWSGNFVILRFEEGEQLEIFWELKETLLKKWFFDIDTIDNFMNKKKLQVWAYIEGIPLAAWHVSVIKAIGSRWGNVIRLDFDTKEQNSLDVSKDLLPSNGGNCLRDVPILVESESLGSSGQSASLGPCFDPSTGLFTIKPKFLKRPDSQIPMGFAPKSFKVKKRWICPSDSSRSHAKGLGKKGVSVSPSPSPFSFSSYKEESLTADAKKSMKVCAAVGLTFDASEEEIIKRFVEVEKEFVD